MSPSSLSRLILLAAIWGGSFMFMRITAPVLGSIWVTESRVFLAAVFLAAVAVYLKKKLQFGEHWRHYLILGTLNSALPFLLFAYAAQTINASLLAILNAIAPIWGAAIAAITGRQALTTRSVTGLALGAVGVAILVGFDLDISSKDNFLAVCAALTASLLYGLASNYAASAPTVESYNNAHGSMWASVIVLLPALALVPAPAVPSTDILLWVLTLGVVCSGIAYLMYFRLIHDEGATSALSVTFLVPLFGVLWGYLFLDETIGWHTIAGALVIITGTMMVTGFSVRALLKSR